MPNETAEQKRARVEQLTLEMFQESVPSLVDMQWNMVDNEFTITFNLMEKDPEDEERMSAAAMLNQFENANAPALIQALVKELDLKDDGVEEAEFTEVEEDGAEDNNQS